MNKTEYVEALKSVRKPADAEATPPVEAAPVEPAPAATPAPEARQEAAPAPAAPKEPAAAAQAPAPSPEPELFKGESLLDPDVRKAIRERWEAAGRLPTVEEEQRKAVENYNRLHGKLAPTQQQLSRMQVEFVRLQQKLNEHESKKTDASTQDLRKRIDAIRQQFPDDAEMWETTLNQVSAANQRAQTVEEKLSQLEQRERLNEERMQLSAAHPDWHKKTARIVQDESGAQVVRRTVDTPEAQEMEVWANGMDPYERQVYWPLFHSQRAQDAIALLNRFEHDRAIARQIAEQASGQAGASATPGSPVASAPAAPTPDPDPSRRTTAPSATRGQPGQPMSDKKRQLIEAAEFLRRQREAKAKQAVAQRR
jgi:hypothetical protein